MTKIRPFRRAVDKSWEIVKIRFSEKKNDQLIRVRCWRPHGDAHREKLGNAEHLFETVRIDTRLGQ